MQSISSSSITSDQSYFYQKLKSICLQLSRSDEDNQSADIFMCILSSCYQGERPFFAFAIKLIELCQEEDLVPKFNDFIKLFFSDSTFIQNNQKDLMQVWIQSYLIEKTQNDFQVSNTIIKLSEQILWPIDENFDKNLTAYYLKINGVRKFKQIMPRINNIIVQLKKESQFVKLSKQPVKQQVEKKQSLKKKKNSRVFNEKILNQKEGQYVYFDILNDIMDIFQQFKKLPPDEIRDKVVQYLNQQCGGGQKRTERNKHKKIFQQIFRIQVLGAFCQKAELSDRLITNSIYRFKQYFKFYQISFDFKNQRMDQAAYIKEMQTIITGIPTAIYWVDYQNKSILQILIHKRLKTKTIIDLYKLASTTETTINITSPILNSTCEPLLYALLSQQYINKEIAQFLFKEFVAQNDDFDEILNSNTVPYFNYFIEAGLNIETIQEQVTKKRSKNPPKSYKFVIADQLSKKQIQIGISQQNQGKLMSMLFDQNQHKNVVISQDSYALTVTITKDLLIAEYQKKTKLYKGLLIYQGLPKQKISWALFDQKKYAQILLSKNQSDEIEENLKLNEGFTMDIIKQNKKIRINSKSLRYQQIGKRQGNSLNSIIFNPGGFIFWYPTYKKPSQEKDKKVQEYYQDEVDDNIQELFPLKDESRHIQMNQQRFSHLGLFKDYFNPPKKSKYTITQPDNVVVCGFQLNEYFIFFKSIQIQKRIVKCFSKTGRLGLQFCLQQKLKDNVFKQLNHLKNEEKCNIQFQWNGQTLLVQNIIEQQQKFVDLYMRYIIAKAKQKINKKAIKLTLNQNQLNYLQRRDPAKQSIQIQHLDKPGEIQIVTDKKIFKEITKQIIQNQAVFKLDQAPIVKEMLAQHPQFLQTFKIAIQFIDQEFLSIKCSLESYQIFLDQLMIYKKQTLKKLQQSKETKIVQNHNKYLPIYQSHLQNIQNCEVYSVGKDIYVIYRRINKIQVNQAIERINEKIRVEVDQARIRQLNAKHEFFMTGIDWDLASQLKQKLEKAHNEKFKNQQIKAYITFKKRQDEFVFILSNALPQNLKIFEQQIQNLSKVLQSLATISNRVHDNKIIVQALTGVFNEAVASKVINPFKREFIQIIKNYRKQLWKIYYKTQKKVLDNLKLQFYRFVKENNGLFEQKQFVIKNVIDIEKEIRKQSLEIKPFQYYLETVLENVLTDKTCVKHAEVKNKRYFDHIKDLIFPQLKDIDDLLGQDMFILQDFIKVASRLKILVRTYFKLKLPIIDHLETFRDQIQKNKILVVKTGTGSGKSSVLPVYLKGIGYERIVVTQPRRLPCKQICKRIESIYGNDVVGFIISGQKKNQSNGLIYMTDGFFKEAIYNDIEQLKKVDVLIIDQIHQRSKNIDLILLMLSEAIELCPKLKVILCSATVDNSILDLFDKKYSRDIFQVNVDRFPVKVQKIQQDDMLDKINELTLKLKKDQQLLAFFPGVSDVLKAVEIFKQKRKKLVYPLFGFQTSQQQNQALQKGQILFSTSIAETSLTFSNLKYVVDSRKSRIRKFDPKLQLMVTLEIQSSQSSKKQRQGRVGRTCSGQYYYIEYIRTGNQKTEPFQLTQLQKSDLSNAIFELILKYNDFQKAINMIKKLNHRNKQQFLQKIQFSKKKFQQFQILKNNKLSTSCSEYLIKYGNLGSYRNNYAMYKGQIKGCGTQMGALIAFLMYGAQVSTQLLTEATARYKSEYSSDVQVIIKFLIKLAFKINLANIEKTQIRDKLILEDSSLRHKRILSQLIKILTQMKKIYKQIQIKDGFSWEAMLPILVKSHKDCIFFNHSLLGGNQRYFQKLIPEKTYSEYQNRKNYEYSCTINRSSLLFAKDQGKYQVILSYFPILNPDGDILLSLNTFIPFQTLKEEKDLMLKIQFQSKKGKTKFDGYEYKDEQVMFKDYSNKGKGNYNFPKFSFSGLASSIFQEMKSIMTNRKSPNFVMDMSNQLRKAIQKRKASQAQNQKLTKIDEDYLTEAFSQLVDQYKNIFTSLKYDLQNHFGCKVYFSFDGKITLKEANNAAINHFVQKIDGFFSWFLNCQKIYISDKNAQLRQPDRQQLGQTVANEIYERINQLVDPSIDQLSIKSLGKKGKVVRSNRINRMIAVCWILINKFNCKIKGGFVRDWVVNGTEYIPPGTDLKNLLKPNPRNKFLQVTDDLITPSDIDVELPKGQSNYFDCQKFIKEMNKLGITVLIQEQAWRKHVLFDEHSETGGFTADLIQPFCHICHDTIDFDVNALYIKRGYLNQLGLKFPLKMTKKTNLGLQNVEVSLEQLIISCRKKEMRIIKSGIPAYRRQKFQKRKWKIDQTLYEPVIFNSKRTTLHPDDITSITKILPNFTAKMNAFTIVKVECLVNQLWTKGYESTVEWIVNQDAQPNQKYLYHGSKQAGIAGILKSGFDSRYFNPTGYYGRGAYFADDPLKSHDYTGVQNGVRKMFVCSLALGKQEVLKVAANNKQGPSKGFHSILGQAGKHNEYIIQRWGQAKPIFLITYR